MEQRFIRNLPAVSPWQQLSLREKRAAIIGCGGLGGYTAELLARVGLGGISLCDGDCFEESNLNRQCLALPSNLGKNKALAAAERIAAIDKSIELKVFTRPLGPENAAEILSGADIVIDALDNIPARLTLEQACAHAGLVLIHGAVEGWSAQVCAVMPGSGMLSRLYAGHVRSGENGTLAPTCALCASLQCAKALKFLLDGDVGEEGSLLLADSLSMDFTTLKL